MNEFKVTETKVFENFHYPSAGPVILEVQNDGKTFAWRLRVGDGKPSRPMTWYQGVLEHEGWFVATAYWDGCLPVMTPFRVTVAKEVK